jgi:hypothetical protein
LERGREPTLAIRPVFHQDERRIEAHIFIAFLLWQYYIQLVAVEEAFKNLKQDLPQDRLR